MTYEESPVFERPLESAIGLLFVSGLCLLISRVAIPTALVSPSHLRSTPETLSHGLDAFRSVSIHRLPSGTARESRLFLFLVLAICSRVLIVRSLLDNRQCTSISIEGFLPILLAVHGYLSKERKKDEGGLAVSDRAPISWLSRILFGELRYLLPTALFSGIYISIVSFASFPRSTYICPITTSGVFSVTMLQIVGLVIDARILVTLAQVCKADENLPGAPKMAASVFFSFVLMTSSIILILIRVIGLALYPAQWGRVLSIDQSYVGSLTLWSLSSSIVLICGLNLISIHGPLHLAMCLYIPIAYASVVTLQRTDLSSSLYSDRTNSIVEQLMGLSISTLIYFQAFFRTDNPSSSHKRTRVQGRSYFLTICFVLFMLWSWNFLRLTENYQSYLHPIESLIYAASAQHDAWLKQASVSTTLNECAAEYRRRYKRAPPPGFDAWYRYAVERSSVIIDDFDNLMDDLQLFWALSPAEIRKRTHEACGDWSEVALLTIRSGKAEIGPDVKPTHRWMLDGVIAMMSNYVDKIPDMDLGFNINDEPRIATPYKDLQILRRSSTITEPLKGPFINEFSHERAQGWNISTDDPNYNSNPFTDQSFLNSFHTYSSISCPPSSPARRSHHWDTRTLCTTCAAPHSKGIFLSNWTLSASPCHQPDLAHLHGFYLSPAAFKPSHTLYPIFSQSKASGYADIRYPSPWNYIDKAVYAPSSNASSPFYDPPWAEKKNIMFWRGATSEGLSRFGEWKGMARQRLVHLANNHSTSTNLPIFLPNPGSPATFSIHPIPASLLPHLGLNITSIHLVEKIDRCWDADCTTQKGEFGLAGKSNFQSHWQYKYLIDLDGAGFSGRFIPFLQSRSLVFKVAGVFREWWDDGRVVAWRHFVPVDVRFQGFWSTVAFFAGTRGVGGAGGGKEGGTGKSGGGTKGVHVGAWKGREEEGERIAREGAEWVRKVMRKEDMEIYFYRLLLEWGRLTDDRRDELGFIG